MLNETESFEKRILRLAITSPEGWCGQDTIYRNDAIRVAREADAALSARDAEILALRARLEAAEAEIAAIKKLSDAGLRVCFSEVTEGFGDYVTIEEWDDDRAEWIPKGDYPSAGFALATHPAPKEAE